MLSAAELIEALQRRLRLVAPHLRRPPGEFPPGWQAWLADMRGRPGVVTGAPAESVVAILAQRPVVAAPRRTSDLTRWQAFSTLWRQQWTPPTPEERPWRWFAGAVSVLWHVFFGALLVWLMYLKYVAVEAPPPEGETVVQVEFIGTGAPDEVGGGAGPAKPADPVPPALSDQPAGTQGTPVQPRPDAAPSPSAVVEQPVSPPAASEAVPRELEPQPAIPDEQPLAISEPVPDRTDDFVLPPPVPSVEMPALPTPELTPATPSVQVVEIPQPQPAAEPTLRPSVPAVEIAGPVIEQPVLDRPAPVIAIRDVPAPAVESIQPAPTVTVPAAPLATPELRPAPAQITTASIPSPSPKPAASAATQATKAAPAATTASRVASQAPPAPARPAAADRPAAAQPGAGPAKVPAAGSWPTTRKSDDWGDSRRNVPGGQRGDDGLYNSDGSVRLADGPGSAAPGNPPGTLTDEITDLDRSGTWLKRPPIGYEPTSLDKYWRPNETLLAEWVRKSIKTVRIPIPGTNKHIVCQTVLLALGGGCGISDPNLNEQPASARPPPDIPFKPELQEDNGSVRPPGS